jgi:hypothetical protein
MNIQEAFNSAAADYDNFCRILIPVFMSFIKQQLKLFQVIARHP